MIYLNNISVIFRKNTSLAQAALDNIQLEIEQGQWITVIGGNGAGKSTLLNVISGDVFPDTGSVHINNFDVTRWPNYKRASLVSRVFQDPMIGTCAHLSLEENLALAYERGRYRGLKLALTTSARTYFRHCLAELNIGLEHRLQQPIGLLSGGQRQAVSLIMATLQPCKILLLDEHTAALDPKMAEVILSLTARLIKTHHLTALMITHSMNHALKWGDRVILMEQGQIICDYQGADRSALTLQDLLAHFSQV